VVAAILLPQSGPEAPDAAQIDESIVADSIIFAMPWSMNLDRLASAVSILPARASR
jgi:hypothetical protein